MNASLPIDSILINRPARQRRQLPAIEELASSISRAGLIHPPVVTRDGTLVAGERRITACRHLGWTQIPVTYTDELDPGVLHLIELEENLARVDIHWRDYVEATIEYNKIRSREPGWTDTKLAQALNISPAQVSRVKLVHRELTAGNMMVRDADSFSVARGLAQRAHERRIADEQHAALAPAKPRPAPKQLDIEDTTDADDNGPADDGPSVSDSSVAGPIICADFTQWAETYSGEPFNFLHCDFPYGVNADKRKQGSSTQKHGTYPDTAETYWTLLGALANNIDRITLPSAHLMFWFSMDYYTETISFFARYLPEWNIQPFPIYWSKSDNVGLLPDPNRGPRRVVETALIGSRGDRKIVQAVANHFAHPTDRGQHMSVKPEPMLRHFFRMFVDQHTTMLDPTCGSGASVCAARDAGARSTLGLEINPEFHRRALDRYNGVS